jgi:hypothetical protein
MKHNSITNFHLHNLLCTPFDETLPTFIKWKHPKKGEKINKCQGPKSKQTNIPKEVSHKQEKELLNIKTSISRMKHIN